MLTPIFDITQNDEFLIINIYTPYIKISTVEVYIEGNIFKFSCHPYFLSLCLTGQLIEDGREKASYDVERGNFVVHAPKLTQGEHFPDLDMITKLLTQPKKTSNLKQISVGPLIEVETSSTCKMSQKLDEVGVLLTEDDDELDWTIDQTIPDAPKLNELISSPHYGFANTRQKVFSKLQTELPELVSLPDPDHVSADDRSLLRIASENFEFDPEHYLSDTMDTEHIKHILSYAPLWSECDKTGIELTAKEKELLSSLPKKEYLLDKKTEVTLLYGLVDLLFSYCYCIRSECGETGAESAWNIWKLSGTLSWLQEYFSISETLLSCYRRSLSYPLYRNFDLCNKVKHDTMDVFCLGKKMTLKCLLHINQLFSHSDLYFVHNDLYIKDYCVWLQSVPSKRLTALADKINQCHLKKQDIGLELVELEMAALIVLEEERRGEQIFLEIKEENIKNKLILSDDEDGDTKEDIPTKNNSNSDMKCTVASDDTILSSHLFNKLALNGSYDPIDCNSETNNNNT